MTHVRISRWTMSYFTASVVGLVLAEAGLAVGLFPLATPTAPGALAVVHLTVLGWLTPLIFGALNQFAPVLAARPLRSEALSLATFLLLVAGVPLLVTGFLLLDFGGSPSPWLPLGGALALAAAVLEAANVLSTLLARRPLPFSARFVVAGMAFLLATVLLGLGLALLVSGFLWLPVEAAERLLALLPVHAGGGLVGFFALTAIGVGYKLFPMFSLAEEERGLLGEMIFFGLVGGTALAYLLGFAAMAVAPGQGILMRVASLAPSLPFLALLLYLFDTVLLLRSRRRRHLELNTTFAVVSLVALSLAAVLGALGVLLSDRLLLAALYLFVYGWLTLLGLSQLYKIVPFLTWIERFGPRLGRDRHLPRVQDLVDQRQAAPWFALYAASVALGTLALSLGLEPLFQVASFLGGLSVLSLALSYRRARRFGLGTLGPPIPSSPPSFGHVLRR